MIQVEESFQAEALMYERTGSIPVNAGSIGWNKGYVQGREEGETGKAEGAGDHRPCGKFGAGRVVILCASQTLEAHISLCPLDMKHQSSSKQPRDSDFNWTSSYKGGGTLGFTASLGWRCQKD